ncbi:hypothetical protein C0995_006501 [Termitomyces sp. Mi166|nr:hypothetical protein C0995_006501 [Termitomyces sp. Mi166\
MKPSLGFIYAPPIRSSHLRSFTAAIYNESSVGDVKTTFNVFAQSLTDVILDDAGFEEKNTALDRRISFHGLGNLRSLKWTLQIPLSTKTATLIPLYQSLETLSGTSHHIKVELKIRLRRISSPNRQHWSALDRTLCKLLDTSAIGSLKVLLCVWSRDEAGFKALRKAMNGLDLRLCIKTIAESEYYP